MTEAVAQLRKGLDVLAGLPDGPWRQQQELDLQTALGSALTATKGYSAAEVEETLARARTLARAARSARAPGAADLGPILVSYRASPSTGWRFALGEQLEQIGEMRNDAAAQLLGRFAHGACRLSSGSSLPPAPSWSGVWALLIQRIAPSEVTVRRSLPCDAHVACPDPGVPGLHRSGTVTDGRSVVGGPPPQTRPYAGSRALYGELARLAHPLAYGAHRGIAGSNRLSTDFRIF